VSRKNEFIYDYIKEYVKNHGYAPSYREIAQAINISVSVVHTSIYTLIQQGKLETDAPKSSPRAYRIKGMKVIFK